jgi:hypothetical protein
MAALAVTAVPAHADGAGAFIGGVLATKVLGNMEQRTEAEQAQAAAAQSMASQQRSSSGSGSAQARIAELDKLAAGGYITPEEYKRKKQAIIDSL